jgi:LmbE family N-acetylglucosaminyl deacetylase
MKIVAIGSNSFDFEIGCIGTLTKFTKEGHKVNLVIAGNTSNWTEKNMISERELCERIYTSKVHFTEKFDYSAVTQDNVNILRSIIKDINPSVAIIPFSNTSNQKKKILAKSSLLACINVSNVLMYETVQNRNFFPDAYFEITEKVLEKLSLLASNKKNTMNVIKKRKLLQRFLAKSSAIKGPIEAFVIHRILLLNDDYDEF